jgi:hypothetical protein
MARNPWARQGLSARNAWILSLEIGLRRGILMTMQAAPERRDTSDPAEFGQVLQFRGRPTTMLSASGADNALARYEQEPEVPIDDRQRMLMNMIAVAIVIVLISAGVWIADTISVTVRAQDCALQGRSNCAPIEAPARQ